MRGRIRTGFVVHARPTPWCAFHDGEEETGHYGWGATEQEARDDLARLDDERAEERAYFAADPEQ